MASPVPPSPLSSLSDYPEDNGDVEIEDEMTTIDNIKQRYAEGVPLFTKDAFRKAAKAIEEKVDFVEIDDWDGKPKKHQVKAHPNLRGQIPIIFYNCYESLTLPCPIESGYGANSALAIHWIREDKLPECSLDELRRVFELHRKTWLESGNCASLTQILGSAKSTMVVDKVLCLGLGSTSRRFNHLKRPEGGYVNAESRSMIQHAAALTIAQTLSSSNPSQAAFTDQSIQILVQDPEYNDLDAQLFSELGITIISDPKGFLEVDDRTFVISVACNVCQKQIIADLARPVGMIWNTVEEDEKESSAWKLENGVWIA